jgi:hypothetical protein
VTKKKEEPVRKRRRSRDCPACHGSMSHSWETTLAEGLCPRAREERRLYQRSPEVRERHNARRRELRAIARAEAEAEAKKKQAKKGRR